MHDDDATPPRIDPWWRNQELSNGTGKGGGGGQNAQKIVLEFNRLTMSVVEEPREELEQVHLQNKNTSVEKGEAATQYNYLTAGTL